MKGARGVLISITGGDDLTLYEVDEAAGRIRQEVDEEANIIVGAIFEHTLCGVVRVSVVATGIEMLADVHAQAEQALHSRVLTPEVVTTQQMTPSADQPMTEISEVETQPVPAHVIPFPELTELGTAPIRRRSLLGKLGAFGVTASERHHAVRASGWR